MKKQLYIAPSTEVLTLHVEQGVLNQISIPTDTTPIDPGESEAKDGGVANWGDCWGASATSLWDDDK